QQRLAVDGVRAGPAEGLAFARHGLAIPVEDATEVQAHPGMRIRVLADDPGGRGAHPDAQFLVQLARERRRDRFTGLQLAAGEFPPARIGLAGRSLAEQDAAPVIEDESDGNLGKRPLVRHARSGARAPPGAGLARAAQSLLARPVAGELPGHAPGPRAPLQREAQRVAAGGLDLLRTAAEVGEPVLGDGEVVVLPEGIERDPQAEALRQRDLLLGGLAGMDLAVLLVARLQVL